MAKIKAVTNLVNENFMSVLLRHVQNIPSRKCLRYLSDGTNETSNLTFKTLSDKIFNIAGYLQANTQRNDRIILAHSSGPEFIAAFLGCLFSGRIAVPLFPPNGGRNDERIKTILDNCHPTLILANNDDLRLIKAKLERKAGDVSFLKKVIEKIYVTEDISKHDYEEVCVKLDDCAFLQYSSGSIGNPKGVMVSHKNISENMKMLTEALGYDQNSVLVSWLPLFHDMGLIGGPLISFYTGCELILIPQIQFIQNPACWWNAVTKYKATITGGPNFAYALSTRKLRDRIAEFDLSNLKVAFNGAEPVLSNTLVEFTAVFQKSGFRPEAFLPCYGMAEATLYVSGNHWDQISHQGITGDDISMYQNSFINCGGNRLQEEIAIVDPNSLRCMKDGNEGEIWLRGPNIAMGYWNDTESTIKTFQARIDTANRGLSMDYLRTGDLGVKIGLNLYITGRLKDLIIVNGTNYYAHDIEDILSRNIDELRFDSIAVFSVSNLGHEGCGMVGEISRRYIRSDLAEVIKKISSVVLQTFQIPIYEIHLIREGQLLKTTSGKIRRLANKVAARNMEINILKTWVVSSSDNALDNIGNFRSQSISETSPLSASLGISKSNFGKVIKITNNQNIPKNHDIEIENFIIEFISSQAKLNRNDIDKSEAISGFGLDSVAIIELCAEIGRIFGIKINQEEIYKQSNLQELIHFLQSNS